MAPVDNDGFGFGMDMHRGADGGRSDASNVAAKELLDFRRTLIRNERSTLLLRATGSSLCRPHPLTARNSIEGQSWPDSGALVRRILVLAPPFCYSGVTARSPSSLALELASRAWDRGPVEVKTQASGLRSVLT
jgi:hypothetical protein